jgi:hypothetical protein
MSKDAPRPRSRAGARTLEASVAASLMLGKLSCPVGERAPTTVEIPRAAGSASAPPAAAADDGPLLVQVRLRDDAVLSASPARATLYTWTTREQIEELVQGRELLTRTESPVRGSAYYDQVLAERAAQGDPLAQKLRTTAFARARHAWPNPWATLLGWPGESYGDQPPCGAPARQRPWICSRGRRASCPRASAAARCAG